jgi:hypothetical protein
MMFNRILRAARLAGGEAHTAVAVNTGKRGATTIATSVSDDDRKKLTDEELERQEGDPLPDRTQMSVLRMPGDTLPVLPPDVD